MNSDKMILVKCTNIVLFVAISAWTWHQALASMESTFAGSLGLSRRLMQDPEEFASESGDCSCQESCRVYDGTPDACFENGGTGSCRVESSCSRGRRSGFGRYLCCPALGSEDGTEEFVEPEELEEPEEPEEQTSPSSVERAGSNDFASESGDCSCQESCRVYDGTPDECFENGGTGSCRVESSCSRGRRSGFGRYLCCPALGSEDDTEEPGEVQEPEEPEQSEEPEEMSKEAAIRQVEDDLQQSIETMVDDILRTTQPPAIPQPQKYVSCNELTRQGVDGCKKSVASMVDFCKKETARGIDECKKAQASGIDDCKKLVDREIQNCKDNFPVANLEIPCSDCSCSKCGTWSVTPWDKNCKCCTWSCGQSLKLDEVCSVGQLAVPTCEIGRAGIPLCEASRIDVPLCELDRLTSLCCETARTFAESACLASGSSAIDDMLTSFQTTCGLATGFAKSALKSYATGQVMGALASASDVLEVGEAFDQLNTLKERGEKLIETGEGILAAADGDLTSASSLLSQAAAEFDIPELNSLSNGIDSFVGIEAAINGNTDRLLKQATEAISSIQELDEVAQVASDLNELYQDFKVGSATLEDLRQEAEACSRIEIPDFSDLTGKRFGIRNAEDVMEAYEEAQERIEEEKQRIAKEVSDCRRAQRSAELLLTIGAEQLGASS